jgi:hypothetical protein
LEIQEGNLRPAGSVGNSRGEPSLDHSRVVRLGWKYKPPFLALKRRIFSIFSVFLLFLAEFSKKNGKKASKYKRQCVFPPI